MSFSDTSTDADGTVASRAWDLDADGAYDDATGANPSHTFAAAGSYTVGLRVTDDAGLTGTTSRTVSVSEPSGGDDGGTGGGVGIPADNLTVNPSFEIDLTGWKTYNSVLARAAATDAPHGGAVVEVAHSGGTSFAIDDRSDSVSSTVAGRRYTAQAYVRAASASSVGKQVRIYLREKTQANALVKDTGSTAVVLSDTFQPVSLSLVPTAGGNRLDVRVSQLGAASGNRFRADAITLVAGS